MDNSEPLSTILGVLGTPDVRRSARSGRLSEVRCARWVGTGLLVEEPLEAGEGLADLFGTAEIGDRIGNGVAVFEAEQRCQLVRVELSTPTLT